MFLTLCGYFFPEFSTKLSTLVVAPKRLDISEVARIGRLWSDRRREVTDRNRHSDSMERLMHQIPVAALAFKEQRARRTLEGGVLPRVHEGAMAMEEQRTKRVMRLAIFPLVIDEATVRSAQRLCHDKNLPLLRREGGVQSLQRSRLYQTLQVELPAALEEQVRRNGFKRYFRDIVVEGVVDKVRQRERMEMRVRLGDHWERVMADIRSFSRTPRPATYRSLETDHQAALLLMLLVVGFWCVVGVGAAYTAAYMASKTRQTASRINEWLDRLEKDYERAHPALSRRVQRKEARKEKRNTKRYYALARSH